MVSLRSYRDGVENVIEVKDTGIGIDSEDLPHIFEQFYRADQARSAEGGTGLGLAIAKKIVEMQGGKLTVESVVGQGSSFKVYLPAEVPVTG